MAIPKNIKPCRIGPPSSAYKSPYMMAFPASYSEILSTKIREEPIKEARRKGRAKLNGNTFWILISILP